MSCPVSASEITCSWHSTVLGSGYVESLTTAHRHAGDPLIACVLRTTTGEAKYDTRGVRCGQKSDWRLYFVTTCYSSRWTRSGFQFRSPTSHVTSRRRANVTVMELLFGIAFVQRIFVRELYHPGGICLIKKNENNMLKVVELEIDRVSRRVTVIRVN